MSDSENMQPYVKPTWIDAKQRLPKVSKNTCFLCVYPSPLFGSFCKIVSFNADNEQFDYDPDSVLAWMPLPDYEKGE